ncbi:MAG TPA: hypothetical protein VHB73_00655 [Alphaproteobacteria bacterium]|nr:hypothetical protein [Alphaproteobacteria bacterium]
MSWSRAIITFFSDAFRPPFRTAPWIALLYAILSVIYNTDSNFNRWLTPDTDDYMRLNQVLSWLNGQSWFDLRVPHLYPQHVMTMHWGRLPDIPLAGLILLFQAIAHFFQWPSNQQSLALLSAFFMPGVLLALLLLLMPRMARPLLGRRQAGLICFFMLLCMQILFQFTPMRVDHHAYIILGAGAAFCCLQALALDVRPRRMAALAGLSLALAMWNGAEILPMVVFFCCALTALIIFDRKNFVAAAIFGLSLLLCSFAILLIARAPEQRWALEYDAFSFFYVLLAGLVAAFFLIMLAASVFRWSLPLMWSIAVFTGLCGLAVLLRRFPDFMYGPYAQVNPILDVIFFPNIREAIPLFKTWTDLSSSFITAPNQSVSGGLFYIGTRMFVSMAGMGTALFMALRKSTPYRARKLWALYAFFSTAYGILTMAWEVRVITYAQLFAVVPLAWMVLRYRASLSRHYTGRKLFALEIMAVFALTLFPVIAIPAIISKARLMPDILFYLGKGVGAECNNRAPVIAELRDMAEREKKIATFMVPMDYTPDLIFQTPHYFIAAPYHRDDRGILDMIAFFRSRGDDASARAIARRLKLDYVLMCKSSYVHGTLNPTWEVNNVTFTYNNNTNKFDATPSNKEIAQTSLGMRLSYGQPPAWLKPIDIPFNSEFIMLEVLKNKLGKPEAPMHKKAAADQKSVQRPLLSQSP